MAITVSTSKTPKVPGTQVLRRITITMDSSYATGGEAVALADLGVSRLDSIFPASRSGYVAGWNGSTSAPKIMLYRQTAASSALVEVPSTTDVSATIVDLLVFGY